MQDPDFDPYLPPRASVGFAKPKSSHSRHIEGNPWITMWTQPRATIRTIVDTDPARSVLVLSMLYGISSTLGRAIDKDAGDQFSLPTLFTIAVVGGSIGGILSNVVVAALVRLTGGWLGGSANFQECRAAVAWGSIPSVPILGLIMVLIAMFGRDLFRSGDLENLGPGNGLLVIGMGIAQIVLAIWGVVLSLKAVGEVHRFSAWRALVAFLLVGLLALGVVIALVAAIMVAYGILGTRG